MSSIFMNVRVRRWTFTHWWVRPVVKNWFGFYHKSITYSGVEHINWDHPLIFAPSHQNAFSDALCIILPTRYTNNRFIYPLIRADAFGNNRMLDWMLTTFHMLPIYRPRDNVNLKEENKSIFADCYEILAKKRNLLIHPEGNCTPKKQVRPFKKGLARIALGAETLYDFDLNVQIIPVGVNYRHITAARGGIHVRYGKPLSADDFADEYQAHPASGIRQLTDAVKSRLEDVTVNIQSDQNYELTDHLIKLTRSRKSELTNSINYSSEELAFNQQWAKNINNAIETEPGRINEFKRNLKELQILLQNLGLKLCRPLVDDQKGTTLLMQGLGYVFLLPIFIYGWVNNIIPWYIMDKTADNINQKQFVSSARMVTGLVVFPMAYLVQAMIVLSLTGRWSCTGAYLMTIPLAGLASLNLCERFRNWRQHMRLKLMSADKKRKIFDLIEEIHSSIGNWVMP